MWKDIAIILICVELARFLVNFVMMLERRFRTDPYDDVDMGGDWRNDCE